MLITSCCAKRSRLTACRVLPPTGGREQANSHKENSPDLIREAEAVIFQISGPTGWGQLGGSKIPKLEMAPEVQIWACGVPSLREAKEALSKTHVSNGHSGPLGSGPESLFHETLSETRVSGGNSGHLEVGRNVF